MEFRPCIDIHNGRVKQIIGDSIQDGHNFAKENFVSDNNADYYAELYRNNGLKGGHVILLNSMDSSFYSDTKKQAIRALRTFPGGMQIGGGITVDNAKDFLNEGASHVILTSFVFQDGIIRWDRLKDLRKKIGKEHIVLDVSCKKKGEVYCLMTNRWQTETEIVVSLEFLTELEEFCDEFLIHATDVEGKNQGIEEKLVRELSEYSGRPVTYAGGIHSMDDIRRIQELSEGRMNFTVGSSLDLFGGNLPFQKIIEMMH